MRSVFSTFFCAVLLSLGGQVRADEGTDFFEKKVRPLLVEHCLECHGPDKHKGGLRWDSREGWQTGGESGPPIVPGKPEMSLMIKAVSYKDRDLRMPPDRRLAPEEIAVLTQWVAMGAPDPRAGTVKTKPSMAATAAATALTHWAYQSLKRAPVPQVRDETWVRNYIDRFVLAKFEEMGLKPAPDATPDVLRRRLAYDLTGLPTVDNADLPAPALIDKLLASEAYAERWAQHWLDSARFAESSGGGRTLPFKDAWRYRDFVLESIRDDVPLDRFITEQLAGDLLPWKTTEERRHNLIATGFLVLGANNYEEQDKELLRMDIVDEQLDVIGKSLLGMSIGCARCHDHKFDPIPTRDYYALAGILRSTKLIRNPKDNVAHWIDTPLPLDGQAEEEMKAREAKINEAKTNLDKATEELKKLTSSTPSKSTKVKVRPVSVSEIPGIVVDDSEAKRVGAWEASTKSPTYIGDGYLHDANEAKGTKTLTFVPKIPKTAKYEVRFAYTSAGNRATNVPVKILHADGEGELTVNQKLNPPVADRYVKLGQFRFEADGQGFVLVSNDGTNGVVSADAVCFVPLDDLAKVEEKEGKQTSKDPKLSKMEATVKKLTAEMKELEKAGPKRPEAMTVSEHEDMGDSPVHIRGQIRNLGPKVPRGYIQAAFHGEAPRIPDNQSGRVQLAQWMVSPDNTLTSRVMANRVWMMLFGEGLVRTPDNFGVTGEKPSHPELLDHLAFKLMDNGWSLKKLVRYIASSHAYAMASQVKDGQGQKSDPENRLLWRQNRKRMDANSLRDTVLAAAGTLDRTFMGPNIVEAKAVDSNDGAAANLEYNYVYQDTRRSVYTPAFRNKRLELFEAFDFGNNNQPIAKRNTSTVAPQALYLMNHDFVIDQSRKAAERFLAGEAKPREAQLADAFRLTLGRPPTAQEARLAGDFTTTSDSDAGPEAAKERWALLFQSLFACVDFRHVE